MTRAVTAIFVAIALVAVLAHLMNRPQDDKMEELIVQLAQGHYVDRARHELVRLGGDAVPALCRKLDGYRGCVNTWSDYWRICEIVGCLAEIGRAEPLTLEKVTPALLSALMEFKQEIKPAERSRVGGQPLLSSDLGDPYNEALVLEAKAMIQRAVLASIDRLGPSSVPFIMRFVKKKSRNILEDPSQRICFGLVVGTMGTASLDAIEAELPTAHGHYERLLVDLLSWFPEEERSKRAGLMLEEASRSKADPDVKEQPVPPGQSWTARAAKQVLAGTASLAHSLGRQVRGYARALAVGTLVFVAILLGGLLLRAKRV